MSSPDLGLVRAIESALMSTWPAIETAVDGAWLVRTADGFSGRSNAVTILDPTDDAELEARIDWAETLFALRGVPIAFRETPLTPPAVVAALEARGYAVTKATHMLHGPLEAPLGRAEADVEQFDVADGPWIVAAGACSARIAASRGAVTRMLANMAVPVRYFAGEDGEGPAAVCQAGVHRDILTVHNVATHPAKRRRGHAARLMAAAKRWGLGQGARWLWIAVEAGNAPALALYARDGLRDVYGYRYWSPA